MNEDEPTAEVLPTLTYARRPFRELSIHRGAARCSDAGLAPRGLKKRQPLVVTRLSEK